MNNEKSKIYTNVTGRILFIYYLNKILNSNSLWVGLSIGALTLISYKVSVVNVFENMRGISGVFDFVNFVSTAFFRTDFVVETMTLVFVFSLGAFCARLISRTSRSREFGY